jgi:regulator of RNase E activity RraA
VIKNVAFERPDPKIIESLRGLPTAAVYDALMFLGVRRCFATGLTTMTPGHSMVGPAITVRYLPTREDLLPANEEERITWADFQALEFARPGDVLVFDVGGFMRAAVLGDVFATRLRAQGALGAAIDGCVRDLKEIRETGLAVYARGCHAGPVTVEVMPAELNVPAQCGGVTVMPGDLVLTDEDGVIFVPRALAAKVAEVAREKETLEGFIRQQLLAHPEMPAGTIYPVRDKTREAYRLSKGRG